MSKLGTAARLKALFMSLAVNRPAKRLFFYRYEISSPRLPEEFDGLKILHLSDLHGKDYGKNGIRLVNACARRKPDIIAFTGDLFSRDESAEGMLSRVPLMKALGRIAPVYYIAGNHECESADGAELICRELSRAGIHVLRDCGTRILRGESYINIWGLELPLDCYHDDNGGFRRLRRLTVGDIDERLGRPDGEDFNLLLAHSPLPFKSYADWGADLTLSGHVHGGIVRLFGIGLLSPERRFFPRYTKGLYRRRTARGEAVIEVSAGLGKFRVNNPESASVCILRRRTS